MDGGTVLSFFTLARIMWGESAIRRPVMLKLVIVITCAVCAAVAGTFVWTKEDAHLRKTPARSVDMPSIQELHAKAHLEGLPVQEIKDPF